MVDKIFEIIGCTGGSVRVYVKIAYFTKRRKTTRPNPSWGVSIQQYLLSLDITAGQTLVSIKSTARKVEELDVILLLPSQRHILERILFLWKTFQVSHMKSIELFVI